MEQKKANWGYVKGIMKSWMRKGITTVEQAQRDALAFRNQQKQKQHQSYEGISEVVPEWFKERKQMKELNKQVKQVEFKNDYDTEDREREEIARLLADYKNERELCGVGG